MQKNGNHNSLSDHSAIKLELRIKKLNQNLTTSWKLNNQNEDTIYQSLWDTSKTVLIGKCIAINAHQRREERSKINTLSSKLKELEEQDLKKFKSTRTQDGAVRTTQDWCSR